MSKLLTAKEVCARLNIKKLDVVTWLVQRELLPRTVLGPKTFRYREEYVLDLINRAENEGLCLTAKP